MTDAQPAAPSAAVDTTAIPSAVDQAVASNDVSAFREARRAERIGTPLASKPAEIDTAPPAEQAASTEVPVAASEAAKPRKTAEDRIPELLADRAKERDRAERAERELAEVRRQQTQPSDARPKADSSPAAADAPFPTYDAYSATHPDASYEEYLDARADYRADQRVAARDAEREQRTQREQATRSIQERDAKARERFEAATAADPEFWDKLSPAVRSLRPLDTLRAGEQPTASHALATEIMESPVGPLLMQHFTAHPEDLARMATLHPRELLKEVGKLEARLAEQKPADTPAPKTVTDAPPPPTQLGRKPGSPANPVDAAVVSGDVRAFRDARQRERIAQLR